MSATVLLKDIVDALEMQSDDWLSFVDLDTGQVETVSRELLGEAEESDDDDEEPDLPKWQIPEWELAKQIASSDRFVKLPDNFHVHEWSIMQDFANSVSSERISKDLLNAIHGSGAFRYFKDTLRRHRIEKDWYAFRSEALAEIARDWCEENQVAWR
jgi:hypothetical protein